jgi:hypothetical protein
MFFHPKTSTQQFIFRNKRTESEENTSSFWEFLFEFADFVFLSFSGLSFVVDSEVHETVVLYEAHELQF